MSALVKDGGEFAVNTATLNNQTAPAIGKFADGRFIVTWVTSDTAQDGDGQAIKAQIFSASGAKIGAEFLVNNVATGSQQNESVTVLANGTVVVTWISNVTGGGVKARLFDGTGTALGGEFLVNDVNSTSEFTSKVVALANGGFVVTWDDWGTGRDQRAQLFDASGTKVGAAFSTSPSSTATEESGDLIALAGGGFVAAWRTNVDGNWDVQARVFNDAGAPVGAAFKLNTLATGDQHSPALAALAGGGFVATWRTLDTTQDGSSSAIKAQIFSATGSKVGGEFLVNQQTLNAQQSPDVTGLSDGGFLVTWDTLDFAQDGDGMAVKYRQFDAAGVAVGNEGRINTLTTGHQSLSALATLADGRVLATWVSASGDGSGNAVRGQFLVGEAVNAAPTITSGDGGASAQVSMAENGTAVTTVIATDPDGPLPLVYAIAGGADAALFAIDAATGALSFLVAPDYEAPGDANGDNRYQVTVAASDGAASDTQALTVVVGNVNEAPAIVSDGGGASAALALDEGAGITTVTTVVALDLDSPGAITYAIAGGADAALFYIDAANGWVYLLVAPDFEAPADADADNIYEVIVSASDGEFAAVQTLAITVGDRAFVETTFELYEHAVGEALIELDVASTEETTFSITGADAALFAIDEPSGYLLFAGGDYEAPADADGDSVYEVVVTAHRASADVSDTIRFVVYDYDEAPTFVTGSAWAVVEGVSSVGTLAAIDPEGVAVHYYVVGGADEAFFAIDHETGALSISPDLDFENPADADGDNVYEVEIAGYDFEEAGFQTLFVTVTDAGGEAGFVETAFATDEHAPASAVLQMSSEDAWSFAISGGADAELFSLDAETGELAFAGADFENPADADGDNLYEVAVTAGGSGEPITQTITFAVGNVEEAPVFYSWANISATENATWVGYIQAIDPDGSPVAYSLVGGADAHLFALDPASGVLTFLAAPDYEAPADADGNNAYALTIRADDGQSDAYHSLHVNVQNVVETLTFQTTAFAAAENGTAVGTLQVNVPSSGVTFQIVGGADAARFAIGGTPSNRLLQFTAGQNFENPADGDANGVYEVEVRATAGSYSGTATMLVTLTDANDAPVIVSNGGASGVALTLDEGATAVTTVAADDQDGDAVTYTIVGGADAARFAIDASTGDLRFVAAPDFEAPADANANNHYEVLVAASDGAVSDTQLLLLSIANVNEGVTITSPATAAVLENATAVTTVTASDVDGDAIAFAIVGGADAALFAIDPVTGAVSFVAAADFEAPADAGGDNVYDVVVSASDGSLSDTQALSVTVGNVLEGPVIVSDGGGSTASVAVSENATAVTTVVAGDHGGGVTYAVIGGEDEEFFTIDADTGALSFVAAPDFDDPDDFQWDNVYEVVVRASNAVVSDTQTLSVIVGDVDEAPVIQTTAKSLVENSLTVGLVVAYDPEHHSLSYSIVGGADGGLFAIFGGQLQFRSLPDFEAPGDADGDNVYDVVVGVSDGSTTTTGPITVTVNNINELPSITSSGGGTNASFTVSENATAVTTIVASDPEGGVTFSIGTSGDAARFTIDPNTGVLRFTAAPDFETPVDVDGDNVYLLTVWASDGTLSDFQQLTVTVAGVNETPVITSNGAGVQAAITVSENATAVTTVVATDPEGGASYAISSGADAARFTIDAVTGALSFVAAPDFEAPADADGDNLYEVVVSASDGSLADTQALSVTVDTVNDAPIIVSNGGGGAAAIAFAENGAAVTTVVATDAEGGVLYAIGGGADAARFTIDAMTGALSFVAAPDFEAPADADGDNLYEVVVSASDGNLTDEQALSVTVGDVNEAPVITSDGGGAMAPIAMNENLTFVAAVHADDAEGGVVVYGIGGGADAARFTIDAATGILTFGAAPDYDAPADANGDNVYEVVVSASDGSLSDVQALAVTIGNLADGLTLNGTSGANTLTGSYEEDTIRGQGGNDTLYGLAAADLLDGGAGQDRLNGGGGADVLTGGAAADRFEFSAIGDSTVAASDVIRDFSRTQGDKIEIDDIDANTLAAGNQAFSFVGSAAFSNAAGQLRYFQQGGDTIIQGDVNGDGVADFQMVLDTQLTPISSDFLL